MAAATATSKGSNPLRSTVATGRPGPSPHAGQDGGQPPRPVGQLAVGADPLAHHQGRVPGGLRRPGHHSPGRRRRPVPCGVHSGVPCGVPSHGGRR